MDLDMNETLAIIHSAQTVHGNFSDQDIGDANLQTVLAASVQAPNASNRQSYSIVVVDDPEKMAALCGYRASRALIYCVDFNRLVDTAAHLGHPYMIDQMSYLITGCVDTALAAQTAALAAQSLGIGCLITNGIHRGDPQRVYDLLQLPPRYCFPLLALLLGYPTEPPGPKRGRLQGPGVIHYNQYRRLSPEQIDAIVASFDDPQTHLGGSFDRSQFSHYLDWFFTVWASRAPKTTPTSSMHRTLEAAGFLEIP